MFTLRNLSRRNEAVRCPFRSNPGALGAERLLAEYRIPDSYPPPIDAFLPKWHISDNDQVSDVERERGWLSTGVIGHVPEECGSG